MLIEAIEDRRLKGDSLLDPLRFCLDKVKENFTSNPLEALNCFIFTLGVSLAVIPAGVGVAIKWIDLACRIDEFVHKGSAITYSFSFFMEQYSRLGDRLVAYLHAKHVGETYGLPVYFKPFKGAEYFALSALETMKADQKAPLYFKKVVHLNSRADIQALKNKEDSTLYVLPYFPESRIESDGSITTGNQYPIDWKAFKPKVQELLRITSPYEELAIPENAFAIALHIRTGGTFDDPDTPTMLPGKLPPRSYYIGELEKLLKSPHLSHDKPLFIHIFTDAIDPQEVHDWLAHEMEKRNLPRVTLSFTQNATLKDDVANMSRFHALIRPDSNLSWAISRVSDTLETEIFPISFHADWDKDIISINQVVTVRADGEEISTTDYSMPAVRRWYLPQAFYRLFHKKSN